MSTNANPAAHFTVTGPVTAPVLLNPGEGGWAEEPKVTPAERQLFGDLAGVVRLLGQAAVATQDAYSLTCKHSHDVAYAPSPEDTAYGEAIKATYQLFENAAAVHREIAEKAVALQRQFAARMHESPVEDGQAT